MKPLTNEQKEIISDLVLTLVVDEAGATAAINKKPYDKEKVEYWMNDHDKTVQKLRDIGITGPAKYNEMKG